VGMKKYLLFFTAILGIPPRKAVQGDRPCVVSSTLQGTQNCAAVPRRARIEGSQTFASLNSRLESKKQEEEDLVQLCRRSDLQPGTVQSSYTGLYISLERM